MSNFLTHLATRSLSVSMPALSAGDAQGTAPSSPAASGLSQPRIPSLFEPYRRDSGPAVARPRFDPIRSSNNTSPHLGLDEEGWPAQAESDNRSRTPDARPGPAPIGSINPGSGEQGSDAQPQATRAPWARGSRSRNAEPRMEQSPGEAATAGAPQSSPTPQIPHLQPGQDSSGNAPQLRRPSPQSTRPSGSLFPSGEVAVSAAPQGSRAATSFLRPAAGAETPLANGERFSETSHSAPPEAQHVAPSDAASAKGSVRFRVDNPRTRSFRTGGGTPAAMDAGELAHHPARSFDFPWLRRLDQFASSREVRGLGETGLAATPVVQDSAPRNWQTRLVRPLDSVIRPPARTQSAAKQSNGIARGTERAEPTIQVTIGTVEVRSILPDRPAAQPVVKRARPGVSLDDYLKRSERGAR